MNRRPTRPIDRRWFARPARCRRERLACERLEPRLILAADVSTVPATGGAEPVLIPADLPTVLRWSDLISGADLAAGVPISVPRGGILILEADSPRALSAGPHLTLRDATGSVITDLRMQAPGPGPLVRQFLAAGDYFIVDESPIVTEGTFQLRFQPSSGFHQPILVGGDPERTAPPTAVISIDARGEPIDLDDDNIPDLVVAHLNDTEPLKSPGGIEFFFGTGDGHYVAGALVAVGVEPDAIAVGRTGGRGSPRLIVTANSGSHDLSVLRQAPDGSFFLSQAALPVGRFPTGVALGDLDGDGLTDIVVANLAVDNFAEPIDGEYGSVTVLLQQTDGLFRTVFDLPSDTYPQSVAIAAMDDDLFPDIVVVNAESDDVSILHQQADGGFRAVAPPTPVGKGALGLAIADLDGDGRTDLVVANSESDSVSILYQQADPTGPTGPFRQQMVSVGIGPVGVLVADVTGDTKLDIVTANSGSNAISVVAGAAKRSFAPARSFAAGSYPVSVAAIPGAGGHIDLLTADANDGTISILRGLGEGDFLQRNRTSTGITPVAVEGVDVNGDGRIDLLTANSQSQDLSVLLGRGDGTFATETRIPLGIDPVDFYAADMNGDGRPDLVVLGGYNPNHSPAPVNPSIIRILLGLGDGSFSDALPPLVDADLTHPDAGHFAIAVGDINDDGLPDVVYAAQKAPPQNTSPQTAEPAVVFHTLLNRGKTFEEIVADGFVGAMPTQIRVADIDRDGHLDLAATNGESLISPGDGSQPSQTDPGNVFVFYGDGQGRFPASSRVTAGLHPGALAVADMDGDAWPDIVVANLNEPNLNEAGDVSVLLQSPGLRTFTELLPRTTVGIFPVAIVAGEFSGDTLTDVIVANVYGKSVSGLTGVGGGRFAPVHTSGLGTAVPSDLAVTDVDGDHLPDLVTVCAITNNVGLLLTDSIPTLVNGASQDVELIRDAKGVASGLLSADRQGLLRLQSLQGASVDSLSLADVKSFASTVVPMPGGRIRIASIDASRRSITIADAEPGNSRPPDHLYAALSADRRPFLSRIVAADLDGNGWGDLVVTNPGAGTVDILRADSVGRYDDRAWQSLAAGSDTSEVLLGDLDGDRLPDLLTVDQGAGTVSVRYGLGTGAGPDGFQADAAFGPAYRLQTSSLGYDYGVDPLTGHGTPLAPFKLTDIALGDVTGDTLVDIVAVNAQAHSFAILEGLRGGGFSAPQEHLVRIPLTPGPVVARTS
ncbi:MAG: hypothetical protein F2840_17860, partial [Actinobacteria bacterium]|nr:hypothetical protein [Actinomycetota bacterium]